MRHISLVDKLVFSWKGNVFRRAITLADVDNDSDNELIVGSLEGNLTIFKGTDKSPWKIANNLGSIVGIAVGDLLSCNKNLLVVISSEGVCNIYNVHSDDIGGKELIPTFSQRLPANASAILIADIDNDGKNELVIGTYDHTLYSFSLILQPVSQQQSTSTQPQQQHAFNQQQEYPNLNNNNNSTYDDKSGSSRSGSVSNGSNSEKEYTLFCKNKWQLPGQIGSLVMAKESGGGDILIVGLCEGTNYIMLDHTGQLYSEDRPTNNPTMPSMSSSYSPTYSSAIPSNLSAISEYNTAELLGSATMLSNTPLESSLFLGDHLRKRKTEIITNISTPIRLKPGTRLVNDDGIEESEERNDSASIVAIATLDGVLKLKRVGRGVVWKMEVEEMTSGQLIALYSVSLRNDDDDNYIVACGWDGLTMVIDKDRNQVQYKFGDRVCAFYTGNYTLCRGGQSTTCFVYVTFFGEIHLYYNLNIQLQPTHSLQWLTKEHVETVKTLSEQPIGSLDEFYQTLLSKLDKKDLEIYLEKLKKKQLLLKFDNNK